jgi:hypothetical protein
MTAERDERGRLLPGHSVKGGRKPSEMSVMLLRAISGVYSPEEVVEYLRIAMDIAIKNNSSKGIMQVLEFQAAYGIGRPTIRIEKVEGDPIQAALDELRRIHAEKQTTYTVIEAQPETE